MNNPHSLTKKFLFKLMPVNTIDCMIMDCMIMIDMIIIIDGWMA
ncbi:hypothetical protein JP0001_14890 [Helicobacter pylori]